MPDIVPSSGSIGTLAWDGFAGRRLIQALGYTGMGLPPFCSLAVYLLLSNNGVLDAQQEWIQNYSPRSHGRGAGSLPPHDRGYTMSAVRSHPELRLQSDPGATRFSVLGTRGRRRGYWYTERRLAASLGVGG